MGPRKKSNSSSKKSSSNQSNLHQQSEPCKFGIQHFFERHSQNQSQNPKKPLKPSNSYPNSGSTLPASKNPNIDTKGRTSSENTSSSKVFLSSPQEAPNSNGFLQSRCKRLESGLSRGDDKLGGRLEGKDVGNSSEVCSDENRIPVAIEVDGKQGYDQFDVSPEVSVGKPPKRFKFSPGMLIKQSQDDGGDEVTWKISPVNERLSAMPKHFPGMIKALADTSHFKLMHIKQCSQKTASQGDAGKIEKWLSSPPLKLDGKSFTCSDMSHSAKLSLRQSARIFDNVENRRIKNFSQVNTSQSPFKTPPSLSYCNHKPGDGVDIERASDKPELRPHKKALIELLDQVEGVLSAEELINDEKEASIEIKRIKNFDSELVSKSQDKLIQESSDLYFLVLEVSEKRGCVDSSGSQSSSKILRLLNEQTGMERIVQLWDEWFYSVVAPGDTVNIICEYDNHGKCDVNHENNFLIVHPDVLVSGSRVAGSFTCSRRTVLDERLKNNEYSSAALIGTLIHQIFQAGLINESPTRQYLEDYAKLVLQKNLEMLYACGVNEHDILKTLLEAIPKLLNWIDVFRDSENSRSRSIDFGSESGIKNISVSEVVDIEEMAWAPRYGLKGMIDGSMRVKVNLDNNQATEMIMPLEFKTGKGINGQTAVEHSAQVMLYMLLMSERYLKNIDHGLLYYLQTDQTQGITVKRSDLVGLIMRRNELANDLVKASTVQQLPQMLQSLNICKGCRHLDVCSVYHKAYGGTTEGSGLGDLFDSLVQHLKSSDTVFLRKWNQLIDLEAKELEAAKRQTWVSHILGNGHCSGSSLSSLVLDSSDNVCQKTFSKGNRFIYRFVLQDSVLDSSDPVKNSIGCTLRSRDYVIVSTESGHVPVANGIIGDIGSSHVSVSFPKPLRLPGRNRDSRDQLLSACSWRIDKDESLTSFAVMRFNLVQLFLQNEQSARLRKMIVELEAPRFDNGCVLSQDPAISYIWSEKTLNDDQRRAILKILTAKDYTLILGMPGTGKTSTMVHAVKALLMRGASILLTSFTNSAVDNLLIKLQAQGIDFLRIGRSDVVHEEVQGKCLSEMDMHSIEDIKRKVDETRVIGVTCLGINSPLLAKKKFDICIMDEAGQITLPVSLGPLMFASKFVLVGDHYQLPPLVQSVEARENGMGVSLFSRLSEAHPQAISALQSQYRMCAGIMDLSNVLIYDNRLRCGSPQVANAKIVLSHEISVPKWLSKVLCPHSPVVFVNTDLLPAFEINDNRVINNPIEAYILSEITLGLVDNGIESGDIGIITPYNAQANLIRQNISASVEIHTIDKYQGRDKDCILVSFVRSFENPRNCSSSLLGDWHRINVAITRAKKKLIMVGSCKTLSRVPLLRLLIERVEYKSSILSILNQDINFKHFQSSCAKM